MADFADAPSSCLETGKTRSLDLVVCIEPAGLNIASQNFDDTVAMMDYIETALDAWNIAPAQNGLIVEYSLAAGGEACW